MVRDEAILGTGEFRDDLRYPPNDLGRFDGDPVFVRIVSWEPCVSLVNTNLQPDAVVLQVVSLLFLEWAALPPRENGP